MSGAHDFKLWRAKTMCWSHLNADGIHWIYMLFRRQRRQFCRALRLLLFFATQDDLGWLLTWIWVTNDLKLDSCGTLMIVIVSLHVSTSLNKAQDGPRFTNNWPILTKCDCVSVCVSSKSFFGAKVASVIPLSAALFKLADWNFRRRSDSARLMQVSCKLFTFRSAGFCQCSQP